MLGQYVTSEEGRFIMSVFENLYAWETPKPILNRAAMVGIITGVVLWLIN